MKRRHFVRNVALAGAAVGTGFRVPLARGASGSDKLVVVVQADGGWDPTSFCDPKTNQPGEPAITHWSDMAEPGTAGNLTYAPFADNQAFYDKYYDRMLVINGVDAQTNSHTTGIVHNWSGRAAEGFPSVTSLISAHCGPDLAMSYLSFGGFSRTEGVARFTRVPDPNVIINVAEPNLNPDNGRPDAFLPSADMARMLAAQRARTAALRGRSGLLPRAHRNRDLYATAADNRGGLAEFAAALPPIDEIPAGEELAFDYYSSLKRQAVIALTAFKTGVSVCADLVLGGFDTHDNHDAQHGVLLTNLTQSIDFLWDLAETLGIADRLFVLIGSDFGRTNFYNDDNGKDHWPIGSYIVMEKNQPWTNRMVGSTDPLHFAHRVDPETLERDDTNGVLLHPRHVHKAVRTYLGLDGSEAAIRFSFSNTENAALFS